MIIAQIADTHLSLDGADSAQRIADFEAVVSDIRNLDPAPDVVVHTGDITQHGLDAEFSCAAQILARIDQPVYVMPGNKDDRDGLRKAFGHLGYLPDKSRFLNYAITDFPFEMVMLDTVRPGSAKGDFCEIRQDEARHLLTASGGKPTIIFAHHPPVDVHVGPDRFHFVDDAARRRLRDVLAPARGVRAIICGHVHRPYFAALNAIPVIIAPATATPLRYGDYPTQMADRAIYFVHRIDPDGVFSTETRLVDQVQR